MKPRAEAGLARRLASLRHSSPAVLLILCGGAFFNGPPTDPNRAFWDPSSARAQTAPSSIQEDPRFLLPISPVGREHDDDDPRYLEYDLRHVDLRITFDMANQWIRGSSCLHLVGRKEGLREILLDLVDTLRVTSSEADGRPVLHRHADRQLQVFLDRPLSMGDSVEIRIGYEGYPQRDGFLGLAFEFHNDPQHGFPDPQPIVSTLSEPNSAPAWWPCKDVPFDKFTCDTFFSVPIPLVAVSNGVLVEVIPEGEDRRVFHWRESYPIATYLVSLAATNYVSWTDSYTPADSSTALPLVYYAYPEDEAAARAAWARTPLMITALAGFFGEYPFLREKYGMAEFNWIGAMEHQTLTSYGRYYLAYDVPSNEIVVAHELAHQWWGDLVTLGKWEEIWLNEGFATYGESLWREYLDGPGGYTAHMRELYRDFFDGPLVPPLFYFSPTTYFKGAWVLHMLRYLLGDEVFFEALNRYRLEYSDRPATTDGLRRVLEAAGGRDLKPFFQSWVFGTGMPDYQVTWGWRQQNDHLGEVRVTLAQAQAESVFVMPVKLVFGFSNAPPETLLVVDSLRVQEYTFAFREPPVRLQFDPDDWILKRLSYVMGPTARVEETPQSQVPTFRLTEPRPNPSWGGVEMELHGVRSETKPFRILDAAGRVLRLLAPQGSEGRRVLRWDGRDERGRETPSGIYWVQTPGDRVDQRIVRLR